jgi:addiction module RelE/StbE family toxin
MQALFHKTFAKSYKKLSASQQQQADARIMLFLKSVNDERLRNHALRGDRNGQWSIDVTGDYRAVYEWIDRDTVRFLDIGTHSELYG